MAGLLECPTGAASAAKGTSNRTLEVTRSLRRRALDAEGSLSIQKVAEINRENGLPQNPAAVTRLELNCQMLEEVSPCLAEYVECQFLHLGRNRLTALGPHLGQLRALRCLYLNNNRLRSMQGLQGLAQLQVLDLSYNEMHRVEGLETLTSLQALLLEGNQLACAADLEHVQDVPSLVELDLSSNQLHDARVLEVLERLPKLQTLTLAHNPLSASAARGGGAASIPTLAAAGQPRGAAVAASAPADQGASPSTRALPHYRRQVVCRCKHLTALDHQPIAPQERAYAEAWWRRQQQHHGDDAGQSASSLPPTPTAADGGAVPSPWQAQAPTGTAAPPAPADFLSPPACAASAAALEGVAAAAAAPTLAEGQQPQQHQAVDVLTGVLRCLPLDSLVCAALACRTWAFAALPVLLAARRRKAQAAVAAAEAEAARLSATLRALPRHGFNELRAIHHPPNVLLQLAHALDVLWRKVLAVRRSAWSPRSGPGGGHGHAPDEREERRTDREQESGLAGDGAAEVQQHQPAGLAQGAGPGAALAPDGDEAGGAGLPGEEGAGAAAKALTAALAPGGGPEEHEQEEEEGEEEHDGDEDRSSMAWRHRVWGRALRMVKDARFPADLALALPLSPAETEALRWRTGSADEYEGEFVPPIRPREVELASQPMATVCRWLLAQEQLAHAAHEADAAERWLWPHRGPFAAASP